MNKGRDAAGVPSFFAAKKRKCAEENFFAFLLSYV